jgi:hypothetical protein
MLNMDLDLKGLFILLGLNVYSCTHCMAETPQLPPLIWAHIRGRYWSTKIGDISNGNDIEAKRNEASILRHFLYRSETNKLILKL